MVSIYLGGIIGIVGVALVSIVYILKTNNSQSKYYLYETKKWIVKN